MSTDLYVLCLLFSFYVRGTLRLSYVNWIMLPQTDIMDLLGSDLPIESDEGMQFAWSDGILLQVG